MDIKRSHRLHNEIKCQSGKCKAGYKISRSQGHILTARGNVVKTRVLALIHSYGLMMGVSEDYGCLFTKVFTSYNRNDLRWKCWIVANTKWLILTGCVATSYEMSTCRKLRMSVLSAKMGNSSSWCQHFLLARTGCSATISSVSDHAGKDSLATIGYSEFSVNCHPQFIHAAGGRWGPRGKQPAHCLTSCNAKSAVIESLRLIWYRTSCEYVSVQLANSQGARRTHWWTRRGSVAAMSSLFIASHTSCKCIQFEYLNTDSTNRTNLQTATGGIRVSWISQQCWSYLLQSQSLVNDFATLTCTY